ncbi:MAG: cyclic nucleotide-binding domain-containing protein [Phycisphaerae bacterium]|nr:cyclic nucleotide-binding domain-containing protein [Phycisphaerae bacterium]
MVPVETLRSLACLAGVPADHLKAVAAITDEREFKTGEVLWREGEPVRSMYIVRQGEIDVTYHLQGGRQCVVDTVVGGEITGWSALVEPYKHTATCVARAAGRALLVEAAGLRELCEKDAVLGYRLLIQVSRTLSSRLQGARLQLAATG